MSVSRHPPQVILLAASILIWAGMMAKTLVTALFPQAAWPADVVLFGILPLVVFAIAKHTSGLSWARSAGFQLERRSTRIPRAIAILITAIALVVSYFVVGMVLIKPLLWLNEVVPPVLPGVRAMLAEAPIRWLAVAYAVLTAGIVEEVVFRGMTSHYFLEPERYRVGAYIALTSLMFMLNHVGRGLGGLIFAGVIGLIFAFAFVRTRELLPLVLAHIAVDWISFR